jgi:uncharacterized linocin/CFP29 family protein
MDYLNRQTAPFDGDLWKLIDEAAVSAAREVLTGRRFLEVEGPYGVGLTSSPYPVPQPQGAMLLSQGTSVIARSVSNEAVSAENKNCFAEFILSLSKDSQ